MNIPVIILAALITLIPLNSTALASPCTINGQEVPDDPVVIEGTNNADIIDCSNSPTRHEIYGYGGNDLLIGSNCIGGVECDDFIAGGGGSDEIHGGDGDDAIDGGAENDTIYGEDGNDVIFGGVGSAPASGVGCTLQAVFIAAGSSYLTKGGSGDDTIYGGDGNDCIDAGSGEDIVFGQRGDDTLEGGNHSDLLVGGSGNDHLDGGWHTDTCVGGGFDEGKSDNYSNCEEVITEVPVCGDDNCDAEDGEDSCSCEADCGAPPANEGYEVDWCIDEKDNDCDSAIDCDDADCSDEPSCSSHSGCGNGTCDESEDCRSCPDDCEGLQKGKPTNRWCCGDGVPDEDAEGDGSICDGNF